MNHSFENTLPIGTILKGKAYQYEIIKVLGKGSFGITYLASIKMNGGLGTIEAYVAIKEFFMSEINGRENLTVTTGNKSGIYDKYRRKFIKEAQSLGKLKHPNIIKVLESFETNNTVYYAMDFIEGGSLDDYIARKGHLSEKEMLEISNQILDALSYMHSKNMLHLDLKPGNVMMNRGKPVLIDFGLSKQYDDAGNPETSTTIGACTPGYAPIEQSNYNSDTFSSKGLPVTMDIYALGATMFKMLTGHRPPIASDILNFGFPESDFEGKNISSGTKNVVKRLMSPLWKDRPQSDAVVKAQFDKLANNNWEETESCDSAEIISVPSSAITIETKKRRSYLWLVLGVVVVICGIIAFVIFNNHVTDTGSADKSAMTSYGTDTTSVAGAEEAIPAADLPDVRYSIVGNGDIMDDNSQLCASINGEEVVIGSINYIFGPDNMSNMNIFAQEDFDGDGIRDALVYDANIGSGGGTTWAFVTYTGDNSFAKSNLFSEASYYEPEISTVDGKKVLDFVKVDMGQRVVKERHGLRNGNAVSMDLPKSKTQAYSPLKSINMDKLGDDGSFYFDLNGDGVNEKITTTGSYHFGRSFDFHMNGKEYEFTVDALWGSGTLYILKSMTKGVHDIMIEQDTRMVYKWNGSTYELIE